jgi:ribosome-binding ATPase
VIQVVRCFEDDDIIHVSGSIDPCRDIEIINLELALADLDQASKRLDRVKKSLKTNKDAQIEIDALEKVVALLDNGKPARQADLTEEEAASITHLSLLTAKPVLYAANVSEDDLATGNDYVEQVRKYVAAENAQVVIVSAQVEVELLELAPEDKADFLESLGVKEGGLAAMIRAAYTLLGLRTYFTVGEKETRAWTINAGMLAPQAAGVIHSDFERCFIRAETIAYKDLVENGSLKAAKEKGLLRSEGKEYLVQEGDVMEFLTSA